MKKKLAGIAASVALALSLLGGSVATAPSAEAMVGYSPCSWGYSGRRAWVKCNTSSYRVGVYCKWWTGGTTVRQSAWRVYAPNVASATCPFGSSLNTAGAFWYDGRLIGWIKG